AAAGTRVMCELLTNGTLLSGAWLDLFERYEVAVGVSRDGPPPANDRHRLTHAGRSSAASAVRGIELLRSRPHLFAGLLAVVDLRSEERRVGKECRSRAWREHGQKHAESGAERGRAGKGEHS